MVEATWDGPGANTPPSDPDALRHEIDVVRANMVESIEQLRSALSPRSQLKRAVRARPAAVAAFTAMLGVVAVLAIRRAARKRREHRALVTLLQGRGRWWSSLLRGR